MADEFVFTYCISTSTGAFYMPFYDDSELTSRDVRTLWIAPFDCEVDKIYVSNTNIVTCNGVSIIDDATGSTLHTTNSFAVSAAYELLSDEFTPVALTAGQHIGLQITGHSGSPSRVYVNMRYRAT